MGNEQFRHGSRIAVADRGFIRHHPDRHPLVAIRVCAMRAGASSCRTRVDERRSGFRLTAKRTGKDEPVPPSAPAGMVRLARQTATYSMHMVDGPLVHANSLFVEQPHARMLQVLFGSASSSVSSIVFCRSRILDIVFSFWNLRVRNPMKRRAACGDASDGSPERTRKPGGFRVLEIRDQIATYSVNALHRAALFDEQAQPLALLVLLPGATSSLSP